MPPDQQLLDQIDKERDEVKGRVVEMKQALADGGVKKVIPHHFNLLSYVQNLLSGQTIAGLHRRNFPKATTFVRDLEKLKEKIEPNIKQPAQLELDERHLTAERYKEIVKDAWKVVRGW